MRFLIGFFLTLCLVSQVYSKHSDRSKSIYKQDCITEISVNPRLVDNAYNGQFSDARELKCYFQCYYQKAGYIDARGEIQVGKLKENVPAGISKQMVNTAIDSCSRQQGRDACEKAYNTQKCLLKKNIEY